MLLKILSFRGDYNAPVLLLANLGNFSYPAEWNVYNYGTNKSITFVVNNPPGYPAHPSKISRTALPHFRADNF